MQTYFRCGHRKTQINKQVGFLNQFGEFEHDYLLPYYSENEHILNCDVDFLREQEKQI
jgi:hypothetical protein